MCDNPARIKLQAPGGMVLRSDFQRHDGIGQYEGIEMPADAQSFDRIFLKI